MTRAARIFAILCSTTLLSACAGFTIHNETRSKLATDGRQSYADAKILDVVEAERKNLDLLLAEEIKVVRENHRLQVDFSLLEIANNSTPMAGTYVEAMARIDRLGFDSVRALRGLLRGAVINRSTQATLDTFARVFEDAGTTAPPCNQLPATP